MGDTFNGSRIDYDTILECDLSLIQSQKLAHRVRVASHLYILVDMGLEFFSTIIYINDQESQLLHYIF